eukprot:scaffold8534_cov79-Skeletonema_dohrnii-CCMP3373.AAC.4
MGVAHCHCGLRNIAGRLLTLHVSELWLCLTSDAAFIATNNHITTLTLALVNSSWKLTLLTRLLGEWADYRV